MLVKRSMKVPKEMKNRFDEIAELITDFCSAKLNEEYKQICLQLCAALCRKRPSPLIGAKAPTWASGIIHTIGMVNFLFYSSSEDYFEVKQLYEWFNISGSTVGKKSRQIRSIMKIYTMDANWTLPGRLGDNLNAWLIKIDGIIVDARNCELWIQKEAYKKGLIPYIPDRLV